MGQLFYKQSFFFGLCLLLLWIYYQRLEPSKMDTAGAWQLTQQLRQAHLNATCESRGLWTSGGLPLPRRVARQLLVEPKHRLLFCEVPKAACSNWRRVLLLLALNLTGRGPAEVRSSGLHRTRLLPRLVAFPPRQRRLLLQRSTRVLVTRHPLERLVSAYRDKLLHSEPYYVRLASRARAALRGARGPAAPPRNLSFPDFVAFVLRQPPDALDVHWQPVERLCWPCGVRYQVLLRHEGLSVEGTRALGALGIASPPLFPSAKRHRRERRTDLELTRRYLRQLSPGQLQGLRALYSLDFALFGYSPGTL